MKHRKFPAPQISEAVFRGKKSFYNFEVYPLNIEFNDVPAVYVISRRKLDKHGRAHHAVFFLGETESLSAEVKSHRRAKHVKEWEANTVSVLLTESESSRRAIEADLKAVLPVAKAKPKVKQTEKAVDLRRAKMADLKMPAEFENKKNIGKYPGASTSPAEKPASEKVISKPKAKLKTFRLTTAQTRNAAKPEIQKPTSKPDSKISVSAKKKTASKTEIVSAKKPVKKSKVSSPAKKTVNKLESKVLSARQKTIETIARKISKAKLAEPKILKTKTKVSKTQKSKTVSAKAKSPVVKKAAISKSKGETAQPKIAQKPKVKQALVSKAKAKKVTNTKVTAKKSSTKISQNPKLKKTLQTPKVKKNAKTAKKTVSKTTIQKKASISPAKMKQPKKRIANLKRTVKNTRRKAA